MTSGSKKGYNTSILYEDYMDNMGSALKHYRHTGEDIEEILTRSV
jgi:hypothetical protein